MTQFIVAADELPNAAQAANPTLDWSCEWKWKWDWDWGLWVGVCGCHCCWLPSGQRKCAQSVTLANEMECFNLAQFIA